jgi:hypothetical protein
MAQPHVIWRSPLLVGLSTAVGLVCGLLGDGAWDVAACTLLAVPVVTGAWFALRRGDRAR